MLNAYIYDGLRTPFGRHAGELASIRPDDLAATVIQKLLEKTGVPGADIEDVILGDTNQAGEDSRNVARNALLLAGLPVTVPGQTVNRLCASGLGAVIDSARAITCGEGELYIAGGVESMSRAPFVMGKAESAYSRDAKIYDTTIGSRFPNKKIIAQYGGHSMPETGDNVAAEFGISREQADLFAAQSQAKYQKAKEEGRKLHFMGLVSDGGVHSHIDHVKGLVDATQDFGLNNVYIHAFTDGRDVDPKSGVRFISEIENHMQNTTAKLASVIGRYFAMDRDNRWERVKLAYDMMVNGIGEKVTDIEQAIQQSYIDGITDEFLKPLIIVDKDNLPTATIKEDDVVICFNYRTDRGREITSALCQQDYPDFGIKKIPLHYVTMTTYDESFCNVDVVFTKDDLNEIANLNSVIDYSKSYIDEYNHYHQFRFVNKNKCFRL